MRKRSCTQILLSIFNFLLIVPVSALDFSGPQRIINPWGHIVKMDDPALPHPKHAFVCLMAGNQLTDLCSGKTIVKSNAISADDPHATEKAATYKIKIPAGVVERPNQCNKIIVLKNPLTLKVKAQSAQKARQVAVMEDGRVVFGCKVLRQLKPHEFNVIDCPAENYALRH
jgi:hypothetical protein